MNPTRAKIGIQLNPTTPAYQPASVAARNPLPPNLASKAQTRIRCSLWGLITSFPKILNGCCFLRICTVQNGATVFVWFPFKAHPKRLASSKRTSHPHRRTGPRTSLQRTVIVLAGIWVTDWVHAAGGPNPFQHLSYLLKSTRKKCKYAQ